MWRAVADAGRRERRFEDPWRAKAKAVAFVANIERKVKAQITTGTVAFAIVWVLGQFGWTDLSMSVRGLIDGAAPIIPGAVAGWLAKHTPRVPEAATS